MSYNISFQTHVVLFAALAVCYVRAQLEGKRMVGGFVANFIAFLKFE